MSARGVLAVLAIAVFVGGAGKAPTPPQGWRGLTAPEAARLLREGRSSVGDAPLKQNLAVRADFDGDGRIDRAMFLVNDRQGEFALFVVRARTGRYERLDYHGRLADLSSRGLDVRAPGRLETACARGLGDDGAACRRSIHLRWSGIGATSFEASYEVFFWNGRRFDSAFLSD